MLQNSRQILPACFNTIFNPVSAIHDQCTRSIAKSNLYIPKYSTSRCQKINEVSRTNSLEFISDRIRKPTI